MAARVSSPRARWTCQPEPVEEQDALQVREQHFDLLPFTARSGKIECSDFHLQRYRGNCFGYRRRAISRCVRMHGCICLPMFRQPVLVFEAG